MYSKKREVVPDLAPMLWHSFGTVAALLQEIVNIYPAIHPPHLTVSCQQFKITELEINVKMGVEIQFCELKI